MAGIAVNMTLDDISYHVKLDGRERKISCVNA